MSPRFTVVWKHRVVERQVADFVVRALEQGKDVNAISQAMAEIDKALVQDPMTQGESRGDYERVLIVPPLSVTFEVHEEERIVYVLSARYAPPRQPGT